MADVKHSLDFLEGGIGMPFDMGVKFFRVEFPPAPPTGFRGQRAGLSGGQIAVNGAPTQLKTAGSFGFGTA